LTQYFADDCVIYRNVLNNNDKENVARLWEWVLENEFIIHPTKSKVVYFTMVRVAGPKNYLRDIVIPESSTFKYLEIILSSD
jgi:hypothetical protein